MGCNCKVTNTILGLIAFVFTVWPIAASKWIVSIAAALVVVHALCCRNCASCESEEKQVVQSKRKK